MPPRGRWTAVQLSPSMLPLAPLVVVLLLRLVLSLQALLRMASSQHCRRRVRSCSCWSWCCTWPTSATPTSPSRSARAGPNSSARCGLRRLCSEFQPACLSAYFSHFLVPCLPCYISNFMFFLFVCCARSSLCRETRRRKREWR